MNSLDDGEECTWNRNKDADAMSAPHTLWGLGVGVRVSVGMGKPLLPGARSGTRCLLRQSNCLAFLLLRDHQNILISSVLMCKRDYLLQEALDQNGQEHALAFSRWALRQTTPCWQLSHHCQKSQG